MKFRNPLGRRSAFTGSGFTGGLRASVGAGLWTGIGLGWVQAQTPLPPASSQALEETGRSDAGELGVPDYLGLRPAGAPNRGVSPSVPGAGVANDFRGLQNMNGAGVPYLGGGGGAGMIPSGLGIAWGRGRVSLSSSVAFSYTDNALQSSTGTGPSDDFLISPQIGVDLYQQVTESSSLSFTIGVGYNYSMNYNDLTQFNLLPLGSLNYSFVVGDVLITFFDRISSPPTIRQEIAGSGTPSGVDFNRIENQLGVSSAWSITEDTAISGMYSFLIDRSLSDSFAILNQTSHNISSGIYRRLSPYWTLGVSARASKATFDQGFQNGSTSYGAGPLLSFRPSNFITMSAGVQYTIMSFDQGGQVGDTREFDGLTWQGSITHQATDTINHGVTFSSGVNSGLGSNFTETTSVQYNVGWRFHERMGLNVTFDYTEFKQSAASAGQAIIVTPTGTFIVPVSFISNDEATQYGVSAGTGYQLTERANLSLSYSYMLRESRFTERSFGVNTVTLNVNYRF